MQKVVDKEIANMLAMGIIEPSDAPYASPLVLVKKPDGTSGFVLISRILIKSLCPIQNQ